MVLFLPQLKKKQQLNQVIVSLLNGNKFLWYNAPKGNRSSFYSTDPWSAGRVWCDLITNQVTLSTIRLPLCEVFCRNENCAVGLSARGERERENPIKRILWTFHLFHQHFISIQMDPFILMIDLLPPTSSFPINFFLFSLGISFINWLSL